MLPAILPMHLSALSILEYRVSRLSSARALAASSGKMKCVFSLDRGQVTWGPATPGRVLSLEPRFARLLLRMSGIRR